jgi:Ca-activated chloride channel family protein
MLSPEIINNFHFLRPLWLLLAIPAIMLSIYFWRYKHSAAGWQQAISKNLLEHLVDNGNTKSTPRWKTQLPIALLLLCWLTAAIALAGPSWQKLPQPILQKQDALVVLFDLSLSMLAEDIKPSRLTRAQHKVLDILKHRNEGLTALIAYSGDAHIVSPLTDDNGTIANLIPALSPTMMPVYGSDPVAALDTALELLNNAAITNGRIILITDDISDNDLDEIDSTAIDNGHELSILGVATTDGAPIPTQNGFLKDNSGNIIVPHLNRNRLEQLAEFNKGRYTDVTLTDDDINFLLPPLVFEQDENTVLTEREFDQWLDQGYLLVLGLLPFALLSFRRGWLLVLPLFFFEPSPTIALEWQDLWQRADQQGMQALKNEQYQQAAELFKDNNWRGSANYQAEDFKAAAEDFKQENTAQANYNRGNALAKAGELDEAINAYEEALKQQPDMEDAAFNKQIVEQLKQQQEEQQQQDGEGDNSEENQEDGDQSDQQNSDQNQSDNSDQNQDDQNQDQQNENDQQQDQSDADQNQQNSDPSSDNEQDQEQDSESEQDQESQEDEQQNDEEQQAEGQQPPEQSPEQQTEEQQQANASATDEEPDPQQQQAMEQWLRQIPDDPSGLLRKNFSYESRLRQQQGDEKKEQPQW